MQKESVESGVHLNPSQLKNKNKKTSQSQSFASLGSNKNTKAISTSISKTHNSKGGGDLGEVLSCKNSTENPPKVRTVTVRAAPKFASTGLIRQQATHARLRSDLV